ncbi:hypothetical protein G4B88_031462 [Cannabis sativa]|uniref:Uncharacterized protein n=1 Tax=Cannabis sativa TaxID=3483 RepID=A0A7J6G4B9_CANSA|nr:hypothetical protein G4B88_031462 [Cannabis sativa]
MEISLNLSESILPSEIIEDILVYKFHVKAKKISLVGIDNVVAFDLSREEFKLIKYPSSLKDNEFCIYDCIYIHFEPGRSRSVSCWVEG